MKQYVLVPGTRAGSAHPTSPSTSSAANASVARRTSSTFSCHIARRVWALSASALAGASAGTGAGYGQRAFPVELLVDLALRQFRIEVLRLPRFDRRR